jgi:hypothetical protein
MEDIVLVTGFNRAGSWANIVLIGAHLDAEVSLGVTVAGDYCSDISWRASSPFQGEMHNHRPNVESRKL